MKRPERHFWYFVGLLTAVLALGLSGQLISCAKAEQRHPVTQAEADVPAHHSERPWNQEPAQGWVGPNGPSVTSRPDIKVTAQLDRAAVLQHGDGLVRVEVTLEAERAGEALEPEASDIVVVVDTSGSMEGQKLFFAQQALLELINRLGPNDRFGLVQYANQAQTLVPLQHAHEDQKDHFRRLAMQLTAVGSTNMSAGLDRGSMLLGAGGDPGRPGRVILLSDGLANMGDPSFGGLTARAMRLSQRKYALSTMGIGADFDEHLMTALATAGTGAFYYLEKLDYLAEFFEGELSNARATYAQGVELRFNPAPGVSLVSAMGLAVQHTTDGQVVRVGSLYSSRPHRIWLTLRAPTHMAGRTALGRLSVGYVRQGRPGHITVGSLPPVTCTTDPGYYHANIHQDVWERAVVNDVFARTQESFGDAIRSGDQRELRKALAQAEQERQLARQLGNDKVLSGLSALNEQADKAEAAQSAPAPVRRRAAKASKAKGYQMRNSAQYDDVDEAMSSY